MIFSDKEGCNNESADGRSDSGSQVHYHKGTADQSYRGSSAAGLGEREATLHSSTTGTPVAEGQRQRKQRCPASLHTPPADHASPSHPPCADNATVQRACVWSSERAGTKGCTLRRLATMRPVRTRTAAHTAPRAVTTAVVTWRVLCGVRHAHTTLRAVTTAIVKWRVLCGVRHAHTSRIAHVGRARVAKWCYHCLGEDVVYLWYHCLGEDVVYPWYHCRGEDVVYPWYHCRGEDVVYLWYHCLSEDVVYPWYHCLGEDTTVSEKTWSTTAQLEDIFRQHTPATAKAPAVHDYVAKLVSNWRQGVDSTLAKSLLEKYPFPDNVDMVVPTVNPEIWADLPSTVKEEEETLRAGQKMYHAALAPMLQACSSHHSCGERGRAFPSLNCNLDYTGGGLQSWLHRWWTPGHWPRRPVMNATGLEGRQ